MDSINTDFWLGKFKSKEIFKNFMQENEKYYESEDTNSKIPLSKFIESQGHKWVDHDFLESSFLDQEILVESIDSIINNCEWIKETEEKAEVKDIKEYNVYVSANEGLFPNPISVYKEDFELIYLGTYVQ